jgi:hypothetical protein
MKHYPAWSVVDVDSPHFRGVGIVQDSPPEPFVLVLVESGNAWWYEADTIKRVITDVRDWPRWVRRVVMKHKLNQLRVNKGDPL